MPRYTLLTDELSVNGTALSNIPGLIVSAYNFFSPSLRRGESDLVPGRRGSIATSKPLDAFSFDVEVWLLGDAVDGSIPTSQSELRANMIRNLRTLARILSPSGGKVALVRTLHGPTGSELSEAQGEYVSGTALSLLNEYTGQTTLEFVNNSGCFYDITPTVVDEMGDVEIVGEFPTRNMSIELPSAGTLTNTTLGAWLTVTETSVVDVAEYETTGDIAGLRHAGDVGLFVLAPGINDLTWSGSGIPTLTYKAARI